MTPVRLEPATPWSRFKHSTTEQLRSLFFQTCLQRQHLKKKKPLKNSKILRDKMGPRMLKNAPNCTIFSKNFRGSMPLYPPAWLRAFCACMEILHVFNIAPPLTLNPGSAPDVCIKLKKKSSFKSVKVFALKIAYDL